LGAFPEIVKTTFTIENSSKNKFTEEEVSGIENTIKPQESKKDENKFIIDFKIHLEIGFYEQ